MTDNDITLSRNVLELVTIATEYCNFVENCRLLDKSTLVKSLKSFVPLLYLRGTLIPDIQPSDPDAAERFVNEEEWESVFKNLREKLTIDDEFWILEDQSENNEPIKASMSEFLTDTYQDMKDFVTLYKKNRFSSRENAVHDVKVLFENNWGKKLSIILSNIHSLQVKTVIEPPSEDNIFEFND